MSTDRIWPVSAAAVSEEIGWPMPDDAPCMFDVGQTITARYPDGSVRVFRIIRAGLFKDVLLECLS